MLTKSKWVHLNVRFFLNSRSLLHLIFFKLKYWTFFGHYTDLFSWTTGNQTNPARLGKEYSTSVKTPVIINKEQNKWLYYTCYRQLKIFKCGQNTTAREGKNIHKWSIFRGGAQVRFWLNAFWTGAQLKHELLPTWARRLFAEAVGSWHRALI